MKTNKILEVGENRSGYFIKRIFTFAFDWYISSVLLNLLVRILMIVSNNGDRYGNVISYSTSAKLICLISPILVGFVYFVLIPLRSKKTQTIMMKVTKLQIVDSNNNNVSFKKLMVRYFIGCFLLQGVLFSSFNKFLEALLMILKVNNVKKIDYFIGVFMISLVMVSIILSIKDKKENKTLHDRISSTKVINVN